MQLLQNMFSYAFLAIQGIRNNVLYRITGPRDDITIIGRAERTGEAIEVTYPKISGRVQMKFTQTRRPTRTLKAQNSLKRCGATTQRIHSLPLPGDI